VGKSAKNSVMRTVSALGLLILLAACSGDPASYGITGPGTQPPPAAASVTVQSPDTSPTPGVPTTGTPYGPSNAPSTGGSGFWGYN
jgi:hypothetical protein